MWYVTKFATYLEIDHHWFSLGTIHKVRDFWFGDFCVDSRWDLGIRPTNMAKWVAP